VADKIRDYKDLRVWQKALDVVNMVIDLVDAMPVGYASEIISKQILSSSTPVCANIAEGHSSGGAKEYNRILKIAYREAKETDNWLQVIKKSKKLGKPQVTKVVEEIEKVNTEVAKMLNALRNSLKCYF